MPPSSLGTFVRGRAHQSYGGPPTESPLSPEELAIRQAKSANLRIKPTEIIRPPVQNQTTAPPTHFNQNGHANRFASPEGRYPMERPPFDQTVRPNNPIPQQPHEPEGDFWEASSIGEESDATMTGPFIHSHHDDYHQPAFLSSSQTNNEDEGDDVDDDAEYDDAREPHFNDHVEQAGAWNDGEVAAHEAVQDFINGHYKPNHRDLNIPLGTSGRFENINFPIHVKDGNIEEAQVNGKRGLDALNGHRQQNSAHIAHEYVRSEYWDDPGESAKSKDRSRTGERLYSDIEVSQARNTVTASNNRQNSVPAEDAAPHPNLLSSSDILKEHVELDYDMQSLQTMSFEDLNNQPFDFDPNHSPAMIEANLPLPERLMRLRDQDSELQGRFFSEMSVDEWEESGDWFLERFGEVIYKLRDVRRDKRDVSRKFEEELAAREAAVRGESDNIKDVLQKMKAGGEGVLRGKVLR